MRVQVHLKPAVWERLCALADKEYRSPTQQMAFLLDHALSSQDPGHYQGMFALMAQCEEPAYERA